MDADKHNIFEPKLAILNLADVVQFRGQSANSAEGGPFISLELVSVGEPTADISVRVLRVGLQRECARSEEGITARSRVGSGQNTVDRIHEIVGFFFNFSHRVNPSLLVFGKFFSMADDHYFSSTPASALQVRPITVNLMGAPYELTTANGIFSPDRIDAGTQVLLANTPPPPPGGNLLDLGCGWGPITLSLALGSPHGTVWAVDVNERALDLVRRNAATLSLTNINACRPEDVPDDIRFTTIWSNPPIRVGKVELHRMLELWLPRLEPTSDAWLVVQRNLGSDSLHRWMEGTLPEDFTVSREATNKGYRVLKVRRR